MDLTQLNPFNMAALAMSSVALTMSTLAVFPWLKSLLVVLRDAILWFALVLVLGSGGFVAWHAALAKPLTSAAVGTNATSGAPSSTPGFTYQP